jgi:UDP-3-O-acyl-N-acetylglucosamine deacetylase
VNTIRRTLRAPATLSGTGLFTGRAATCTILPAADGGIRFRRADLPGPDFPATIAGLFAGVIHPAFKNLSARNTILALPGSDRPGAATVEHLLSALAGLGITDALVELAGDEVPIDDGSAAFIARAIRQAGIRDLDLPAPPNTHDRPIIVSDATGARIEAAPADSLLYTYNLDYGPGAVIPAHSASWTGDPDDYAANIAPARTFCLESEARSMRALGLFQSLSPKDLLVFGPAGPIDNALRTPDEPARHKLLDLIGDLSLAGRPIQARITATRSGHALNHELARRLAAV